MIRLNSGRIVSPARHYEIWRAKNSNRSALATIRAIAAHPNNSPEFQAELDRVIAEADKRIEEFNQWQADLERHYAEAQQSTSKRPAASDGLRLRDGLLVDSR